MLTQSNGQRHDRSALILFGSETGNSEDAAERLSRITERLRFVTIIAPMDLVALVRLLQTPPLVISPHKTPG